MNISKTKRNFICWHTLFAVISAALGAVILHFALPGIISEGIRLYRFIFTSSGWPASICSTLAGGTLRRDCYCCIWQ